MAKRKDTPVDVTAEPTRIEPTVLPPVQFDAAPAKLDIVPERLDAAPAKAEPAPANPAPAAAALAKLEAALTMPEARNLPPADAPQIVAPQIAAPQVAAPQVAAPQIAAPQVAAPRIEAPRIEAPRIDAPKAAPAAAAPLKMAPSPVAPPAAEPARSGRFALLAASVAFAAGTGAVLGAAGTAYILPARAAVTETAQVRGDDIRALKESIVRLSSELTAVKATVESAAKSTNGQVARLAQSTEKAIEKNIEKNIEKAVDKATEKAQAEPNAKLSKIAESLDRLEKRPVQAAAGPVLAAAAPAAPAVAANDVTGSVPTAPANASKQDRPAIVEGWIVRDFFDGRALVESRFGTMLEVGPGSSIPGVGRVDAVRRQDGRIVVVTQKGLITSFR